MPVTFRDWGAVAMIGTLAVRPRPGLGHHDTTGYHCRLTDIDSG